MHNFNILGNYFNKHETNHVLYRTIVNRYKRKYQEILRDLAFDSFLEIGSGEGYIVSYTLQEAKPKLIVASDINMKYFHADIGAYRLVCMGEAIPFPDKSFDLVVACEVLEHTKNSEEIVKEMSRVSKKWVIISVPYEPYWRLLNIIRGKYLNNFGNTPGHVSHFSLRTIIRLCSEHLFVIKVKIAFPWIFILSESSQHLPK